MHAAHIVNTVHGHSPDIFKPTFREGSLPSGRHMSMALGIMYKWLALSIPFSVILSVLVTLRRHGKQGQLSHADLLSMQIWRMLVEQRGGSGDRAERVATLLPTA